MGLLEKVLEVDFGHELDNKEVEFGVEAYSHSKEVKWVIGTGNFGGVLDRWTDWREVGIGQKIRTGHYFVF